MLSDPTLELLYKGNIGIHYTTMQGSRTLPNLDPRQLFNAAIGIYSAIGGIGILFWAGMAYQWVSRVDDKPL
ncbi:hypothetical protein IWW51_000922 [Coemansia sp. RSA 2702]|nr:hypothetical protein IWW51_000922 [Coemansia sp. RSA 2702]